MAIRERFIINQALISAPAQEAYQKEAAYIPIPSTDIPSRFRRKKGYTGKTVQPYNKNYKSMPKDF